MTSKYTLADLKADLDKQYKPFVLDLGDEEVTLQNVLRISEKDRKVVLDAVEGLNVDKESESVEDIDGALDALKVIIKAVTAKGKGQKVLDSIGDDLALGMRIFELWMEATQPGEASNSPDSSTSTASV